VFVYFILKIALVKPLNLVTVNAHVSGCPCKMFRFSATEL